MDAEYWFEIKQQKGGLGYNCVCFLILTQFVILVHGSIYGTIGTQTFLKMIEKYTEGLEKHEL